MANYSIEDDLCSDEGLRHLFNYLLPRIETNSTITYGEIAEQLAKDLGIHGRIFTTQIGHVVGTLMNRILEIEANAPLLNLLVVNTVTGQPGKGADGYLRDRFGLRAGVPIPNRESLVEQEGIRVFAFKHWPRIYRRLFKVDSPDVDLLVLVQGTEADGMPPNTSKGGWGGEAESAEHKALKAYVLARPGCVGAPLKPDKSKDEFMLLSGDEIDVVFEHGNTAFLVEVKSSLSGESDFVRGVYQCVKYRAVYLAQCKGVTPNRAVHAILAVEEEPPGHVLTLAKNNSVRVQIVARD